MAKYKVIKTKTGKRWKKVNGRMKSPKRTSRGDGEKVIVVVSSRILYI